MSAIAKSCAAGSVLVAGACVSLVSPGDGPRYVYCGPNAAFNLHFKEFESNPAWESLKGKVTIGAYVEGIGVTCQIPSGYVKTDLFADSSGETALASYVAGVNEEAKKFGSPYSSYVYPYYVKG